MPAVETLEETFNNKECRGHTMELNTLGTRNRFL